MTDVSVDLDDGGARFDESLDVELLLLLAGHG